MTKEILEQLLNKQTVANYKKACKYIKEESLVQYSDKLLTYLNILLKKNKSYEMICILIETLGKLKSNKVINQLNSIIENNLEYDLITSYAAKNYIRITGEGEIIKLLKYQSYSVKEGVLNALGYDKIIPSLEKQEIILNLCWDFGINRKKGYTDPRYGLAAACAGWKSSNVKSFLTYCLSSSDEPLKHVAKNSLNNIYSKLR